MKHDKGECTLSATSQIGPLGSWTELFKDTKELKFPLAKLLPSSLPRCVEKFQQNFLWDGLGEEIKFHLVNWPTCAFQPLRMV